MQLNNSLKINSFDDLGTVAELLYNSGVVGGAKNLEQVAAIIMFGQEIGISPVSACTQIKLIQGKPTFSANLIANLVKMNEKYDFRLLKSTSTECEIEFFQKVKEEYVSTGVCSYTIEEAKTAGLVNSMNWKKYPKDLLYARCISRGVRQHAPDAGIGLTLYVPEEIESVVGSKEKEKKKKKEVKVENNGITDWIEPDLSSPEALENWAKAVLASDDDKIAALFNDTIPDAEGKVALTFVADVRAIWEHEERKLDYHLDS